MEGSGQGIHWRPKRTRHFPSFRLFVFDKANDWSALISPVEKLTREYPQEKKRNWHARGCEIQRSCSAHLSSYAFFFQFRVMSWDRWGRSVFASCTISNYQCSVSCCKRFFLHRIVWALVTMLQVATRTSVSRNMGKGQPWVPLVCRKSWLKWDPIARKRFLGFERSENYKPRRCVTELLVRDNLKSVGGPNCLKDVKLVY